MRLIPLDRVLYLPARLTTLGRQASQENSPFAVTDRIGLISDATVLGKSGLLKTSAGLGLINELKSEQECEYDDMPKMTTQLHQTLYGRLFHPNSAPSQEYGGKCLTP